MIGYTTAVPDADDAADDAIAVPFADGYGTPVPVAKGIRVVLVLVRVLVDVNLIVYVVVVSLSEDADVGVYGAGASIALLVSGSSVLDDVGSTIELDVLVGVGGGGKKEDHPVALGADSSAGGAGDGCEELETRP